MTTKWKTVGIVPKFVFKNEGDYLEGHFARMETIQPPDDGKKKKESFKVWIVADGQGREWALSGGHIDYLFGEKAQLKGGEAVRVTWLGWSEMEDGNKARAYNLEVGTEA